MKFGVHLIQGPVTPTGEELNHLQSNCRYIEGRWWIFEGDLDAWNDLGVEVKFWRSGVVEGTHEDDFPPGDPIINLACEVFDLEAWPPQSHERWPKSEAWFQ